METAVQDFWKTTGLEKTVLLFWPSQAKSLLLDIGFSSTVSYFIDAFMLFLLLVTLAEYIASESLWTCGTSLLKKVNPTLFLADLKRMEIMCIIIKSHWKDKLL